MLHLRRARAFGALLVLSATAWTARASADPLTAEQRTERCARIRDVAAQNGISAGYLFAGIANAETSLSHCWSELSWACQGPESPDCGGPVVAGAGDGPCSLHEGGLGMFQFDGGTFDETMARDGDGVLLLAGNVTRAIDFVVNMVQNSQYVDVDSPEEAKAWLNEVEVDGMHWDAWIKTVTHYYNGCTPTGCSVYAQRYAHYDENGRDVYDEQGADFWQVELGVCAPIGSEPTVLEETDPCFTKGGPLPFWRVGIGGESNLHVWTGTTAEVEAINYAEWMLEFEEAGEYLVEVSVHGATSKTARYEVDYAGMTEEITIDQSASDGFVELGTFNFTTTDAQRVLLGDNTGEPNNEKLVVDAIRVTRIDMPEPVTATTGSAGPAGVGEGGAGGAGGAGFTGDPAEDDGGCSCSAPGGSPSRATGALAMLAALFLAPLGRRRRRRA